ncbi:hypothetical protein A5636_01405 [Mycobacterium asiaticum]|uniref:Uncharacterized protein n=1 Tax=Mycobacterium asiaticum TaxID=1790 RepID=A0A1A3MVZ5_MYCAS|nr:hypothetical protein A5636_01405 [Mycobacterium asiaticum]
MTHIVTWDATAHDGAFHAATDDPDWAESSCFAVSVPERGINGFVYFFHDARCGISGGGPALWDPSGEHPHDCLFYDWRWRQPPTGAIDFTDFTLPNSLRHHVVEPSRRHLLEYSGLGLQLALEWTALMPPHPLGPADAASGHFDQPGRMTGKLSLEGEHFDVDCCSMRDRTWGPHRAGAIRSGDYLWAIASEDDHWHALTMESRTPGVDKVVGGYLVADGRMGELVSGERRVGARRDGAPAQVVVQATDEHGRTLHADGEVRTVLRWLGWPGRLTYWTLTDWHWDGVRGWGENQEFHARERARHLG